MTLRELDYTLEREGLVEAEKPHPSKFLLQIYQSLVMIPKEKLPNLGDALRLIQVGVAGSEFNLRYVRDTMPRLEPVIKLDNRLEIQDWILSLSMVRADDGGLDLQVEAKEIADTK